MFNQDGVGRQVALQLYLDACWQGVLLLGVKPLLVHFPFSACNVGRALLITPSHSVRFNFGFNFQTCGLRRPALRPVGDRDCATGPKWCGDSPDKSWPS